LYPNGLGGYAETNVNPGPGFGNVAFGEDASLEMYLCNIGGTIYRIRDTCGSFSPVINSSGTGDIEATAGGSQYWWWNEGNLITSTVAVPSYTPELNGTWYVTVNDGNGCIRQSNSLEWLILSGIAGCTYPGASNYNPEAEVDDGSCVYAISGCMDILAVNYNPLATEDDGSCEYGVVGCMTTIACNYDPQATIHDCDACDFISCLGCIEPCAPNYDPAASLDDGSCLPCPECAGDLNDDQIVNVGDLLLFMATFGTTCE
jgi:hypothetical protein